MPSWTGPTYPFSLFSILLLLPPASLPPSLCVFQTYSSAFISRSVLLFLLPVFCTCCPLILERWAVTSSGKPSMTSNTWIKHSFLSVPFLCTLESLTSQSHCCTALDFVVSFSVTVSSARAVTTSLYFSLYPQHLMALYHHHYYHDWHLLSTY